MRTSSQQEVAIRFVDVCVSFAGRSKENVVLDHANFTVPQGKTTVIAGGSGQGKSVILKLILGLLRPNAGQVLVGEKDIATMGYSQLQEQRMRFWGLVSGLRSF